MEEVIGAAFFWVFFFGFIVIILASYWKLYVKAGREGWEGIIPIYNTVVMLQLVKKPVWWILLLFIPLINIIFGIWIVNLFVKGFGKDEAFTIGVIILPFIFLPILAFGDSRWHEQPVSTYGEEDQDILDSDLV